MIVLGAMIHLAIQLIHSLWNMLDQLIIIISKVNDYLILEVPFGKNELEYNQMNCSSKTDPLC